MSVRALFAEPEQTFEPEHFTAKWSRNVRKGGKATLTVKASADVEAIHVDDVTIDSYKVRHRAQRLGLFRKEGDLPCVHLYRDGDGNGGLHRLRHQCRRCCE
ncbi:MAG: hypothetical protein ACLUNO_01805 [Oscillospiraceae bacterium]